MSQQRKIYHYKAMRGLVNRLRDDLRTQDFVLLFAYNGTGKTRLSMAFKDRGKRIRGIDRDTLYYNAFTEDLFHWHNDFPGDSERHLILNTDSQFFNGFEQLALEEKIFFYLSRYADFDFKIDYEKWTIRFSRDAADNIKISRGEENIFIWCIFLAICELAIDGAEAYEWVRFLYIDDPISSLDDNNAIAVASDLAQLLKDKPNQLKTVISSHHGLFFNVMCNELKKKPHKQYFLHSGNSPDSYDLQTTEDTPFFYHVAMLSELRKAADSNQLYTYHFNVLRSILEKTASFFGFDDFSDCIHDIDDEVLFARALNLLSHGDHSLYDPRVMGDDTQELFRSVLDGFLNHYEFQLPTLNTRRTPTQQTPPATTP